MGWLLVLGHPIFFRSIGGGKGLAGALLGLSCLLIYQKNLGEVLGSGIFVVLLQLERLYSPHCGLAGRLVLAMAGWGFLVLWALGGSWFLPSSCL